MNCATSLRGEIESPLSFSSEEPELESFYNSSNTTRLVDSTEDEEEFDYHQLLDGSLIPDQLPETGRDYAIYKAFCAAIRRSNGLGLKNLINLNLTIPEIALSFIHVWYFPFNDQQMNILSIIYQSSQWKSQPSLRQALLFAVVKEASLHDRLKENFIDFFLSIPVEDNDFLGIDSEGKTLLHHCIRENENFVKILIDKGLDINIADNEGNSCLHQFFRESKLPDDEKIDSEILSILVSHQVDLNLSNSQGLTPLSYACGGAEKRTFNNSEKPRLEILFRQMKFLVSNGANVEINSSNRNSELIHVLCQKSQLGFVDDILDRIVNVAKRDANGNSPLDLLVKQLDQPDTQILEKIILKLISRLPQYALNIRDSHSMTPLHWAVRFGYLNIAQSLVDSGANPALLTTREQTLLHLAVISEDLDTLKYCLTLPIDINANSKDGMSALDLATKNHEVLFVDTLLSHGASYSNAYPIALAKHDLTMIRKFLMHLEKPFSQDLVDPILQEVLFGKADALENMRLELNHYFLNSDLVDMREFILVLWKFVENQIIREDLKEKIQTELLDICGGFFTWGSIVSRFKKSEHHQSIRSMYGSNSSQDEINSYVLQQVNFGTECFEAVFEAFNEVKSQNWDFWQVMDHFVSKRSQIQKEQQPKDGALSKFSKWRVGPFATSKEVADTYSTPAGSFESTMRYSAFQGLLKRTFKMLQQHPEWGITSSEDDEKCGRDAKYQITYIHPESNDKFYLTEVQFAKMIDHSKREAHERYWWWNHATTTTIKKLFEMLPRFHNEIFSTSTTETFFRENCPIINQLMSHQMLTERGFAQYSLMWLALVYLYHNKILPPVTLNTSQLDCHLISTPFSKCTPFGNYFEPFQIEIDNSDISTIHSQIAVQFLFGNA